MSTASPTPMGSYSSIGRMRSQPSIRPRRDSPMSVLGQSEGFSANAPMMQNIDVGDSSDDELLQPMKLSALTEALLKQNQENWNSPDSQSRKPKLRISRSGGSGSSANTPVQEKPTPANSNSLRVRRLPVRGGPVRRMRRTPQSEDEMNHPPSQDQENVPMSAAKVDSMNAGDSIMNVHDSVKKPVVHEMRHSPPIRSSAQRQERPAPLQPISANTPRRPAPPPPPPKMSVLKTATASAGAATTKTKERRKRSTLAVNGKHYQQMDRIGRGGSSAVYRVMAENYKLLALKRVKLEDADEAAVRGFKGEIDLLKKLEKVERVVRLYDWEVDEQKQILSVLMELGESDLARIIRLKLDSDDAKLDMSFTRYYWKEMLECVGAVHNHDIIHSDLKPANFVLVQGRLKLIDFGIANAIETDHTVNVHRESHIGTPNYMSPESLEDCAGGSRGQLSNGNGVRDMKLGKSSDVWSLGCILYQMVYGRPPFAHIANQMSRVLAIINRNYQIDYPDVGVGGVRIPPGLKRTMRRCLDREAHNRPTISQLLLESDPFIYPDAGDDLPISMELLSQVIHRVADRFRDPKKEIPTEEEIAQYPASFYAKIRQLLESS